MIYEAGQGESCRGRREGLKYADRQRAKLREDEAWPFAFGRMVTADKGSEPAATGRMRVRGLMGD